VPAPRLRVQGHEYKATVFPNAKALAKHARSVHAIAEAGGKCPHAACATKSKVFPNATALAAHVRYAHSTVGGGKCPHADCAD
jgi:hypothetical protein